MAVSNVDTVSPGNPLLRVEDYARREGAPPVAICRAQAQIADLGARKQVFLTDMGCGSRSPVDDAGYKPSA